MKGLPLVVVGDLDWVHARRRGRGRAGHRRRPGAAGGAAGPAPAARLGDSFGAEPITVRGTAHDVGRFTLRLTGDRVTGSADGATSRRGRVRSRRPCRAPSRSGTARRRRCGATSTSSRPTRTGAEVTVRASSGLQQDAPAQSHGWRVRVSASRVLAFRRVKDLEAEQASAYGRQVLRRTVYPRPATRPAGTPWCSRASPAPAPTTAPGRSAGPCSGRTDTGTSCCGA